MKNIILFSGVLSISSILSLSYAAIPLQLHRASVDVIQDMLPMSKNSSKSFSIKPIEKHSDQQGIEHRRLQQYYSGFPVWNGYVVEHTSSATRTVNGVVYRDIDKDIGQPPQDYMSQGRIVLHELKTHYSGTISDEIIKPMVYIDELEQAHWVYFINFRVENQDSEPQQPAFIIDAITHESLLTWNEIKTMNYAKGQGYGGNVGADKIQYGGGNKPFLEILRGTTEEICAMQNQYVSVYDMNGQSYGPGKLATFDCPLSNDAYWTGLSQDGYDKANGAYSVWNDALYIGTVVFNMYQDWYQLPALGTVNKPKTLMMRVHFGKNYENAFWDGKQMSFGDGGEYFYPLVGLTVGAHEISHGFTEQYSDLVYVNQSGGMNEAFSDMAAQAVQFYSEGKVSWSIGAEVMKDRKSALRYLDKPSQDGKSIQNAKKYYKGLDVHYSSGVYNHFFYLLANKPGWNVRQAFGVMVKANMDYWVPTSNFVDGACGVLWAAADLGLDLDAIQEAFDAVSIETKKCS